MQLRYDQLEVHLRKNALAPIYLIQGDEPLLVQEACQLIRDAAFKNEFTEKQVFHVETKFNWTDFQNQIQERSLFSTKQLIELRTTQTFGATGNKAIEAYAKHPITDKILLISGYKFDTATQKSAWWQAISQQGVIVTIWPIQRKELPAWIMRRLSQLGMQADRNACELLAEYLEGNLLACAQEIEKLYLLYGATTLNAAHIKETVANQARYLTFDLLDAVLQGDSARSLRMLQQLEAEGCEPLMLLGLFMRELRILSNLAFTLSQGMSLEKAFLRYQVWEKRKPLVRNALQRHSLTNFYQFLHYAAQIEQTSKGLISGNVWHALQRLALAMADAALTRRILC